MSSDLFEVLNVVLQIIFASISIIVGIKIISKYPKHKRTTLLLVGIVWIGMAEPWYASILSFLFHFTTGKIFTLELYLFIAVFFIPFTLIIWSIAFTMLVYKEKQKLILTIVIIYNIIFETIFLYFLFTEPSRLGILHGPINIEWQLFLQVYFFSVLAIFSITGILFFLKTQKSENPEVRLKGKFLLMAFLSYSIGSIIDAVVFTENIAILLITRLILITSAIEFYCGFILPEGLKKRVIE